MSPTHAEGTLLRRPWYPRTLMSFSSLAPVLSAQVMREPKGRPLAIRGRYSIIPRALTALVFGAGMSYSTAPLFSTTTKLTSLLTGLHSAIVTVSPAAAATHGGLWARIRLVLLSYLLYFGW